LASITAGFGLSVITPRQGSAMVGYANRMGPSVGVHDDLHSRALVVDGGDTVWALSANELCELTARTVAAVRERVAAQVPIPPKHIHLCTVHTHSGPYDCHPQDWDRPLSDLIAQAIVQAYHNRVSARIGGGRGRLEGYTINRRFIDRPTDPGMAVLRVDSLEGQPLGLVVNWNCHGVVLGYDNLLTSADFPGVACTELEHRLAGDAVALYVNGGAGDVNPLVAAVRARLTGEYAVDTMVAGVHYYGTADTQPRFRVGDRGGGTFAEAEELGLAVAAEAWKIIQSIQVSEPRRPPWVDSSTVRLRLPDAPPVSNQVPSYMGIGGEAEAEVAALGVGHLALVGEPGEVFAETFVDFKRRLWQMGYRVPMAASYMDGFFWYLPPAHAFAEGGMEIERARAVGLREDAQAVMWEALEKVIRERDPGL
jgi:neutral ceramidase